MPRIAIVLGEWRDAERRRRASRPGSEEWQAADDEVRRAQATYRGEAIQAAAYYAEVDFAADELASARWPGGVNHPAAAHR